MKNNKTKEKRPRRLSYSIYYYFIIGMFIILILASGFEGLVLYNQYRDDLRNGLNNEIDTMADLCDSTGSYKAVEQLHSNRRITVMDDKGKVLFDNVTSPSKMDDHSNRPEWIEAMETGRGFAERRSNTIMTMSMYAAERLSDGTILRLSGERSSLWMIFRRSIMPQVLIILSAAVLAMLLARRSAKNLVKPINRIDLRRPLETEVYEEILPLTTKIDEQNREIAANIEEIRRKHKEEDLMRIEFTANVSHELKTPLTSISGYAELIETGIANPEDVQRFGGIIHKESQRLITLVGDIIKLSQLDEDEVAVVTEDIDLYETSASVLTHLERAAENKDVTLHLDGEHATIHGVAQITEEVIYNLCDNAIKYNREGGDVFVTIRTFADGIELTVRDTGIGIPQKDLEYIFDRFYRVDKSHSKDIGGTGLGLSIVRHGAQYLGADLSVESTEGEGTTFRLLF